MSTGLNWRIYRGQCQVSDNISFEQPGLNIFFKEAISQVLPLKKESIEKVLNLSF
jgi:hypothetical protein